MTLLAAFAIAAPTQTEDVWVMANGQTADDLGAWLSPTLSPLQGRGSQMPSVAYERRKQDRSDESAVARWVRGQVEVNATLRAFGVGSAGGAVSSSAALGQVVAVKLHSEETLAFPHTFPRPPEGAEWFISGIRHGWMHSVLLVGGEASVEGSLKASGLFPGATPSAGASMEVAGVQAYTRALGMRPREGSRPSGNVMTDYTRDENPVPIQVRYSRVIRKPDAGSKAETVNVLLRELRVPASKPNGMAWDFGSGPDPWLLVTHNGVQTASLLTEDKTLLQTNALLATGVQVGSELTFLLRDRDLGSHDAIAHTRLAVPAVGEHRIQLDARTVVVLAVETN